MPQTARLWPSPTKRPFSALLFGSQIPLLSRSVVSNGEGQSWPGAETKSGCPSFHGDRFVGHGFSRAVELLFERLQPLALKFATAHHRG